MSRVSSTRDQPERPPTVPDGYTRPETEATATRGATDPPRRSATVVRLAVAPLTLTAVPLVAQAPVGRAAAPIRVTRIRVTRIRPEQGHPDAAIRDGQRVFELSRRMMAEQKAIEHAETPVMALAELGRFDEVTTLQQQVAEQLTHTAPGEPRLENAHHRLEAYRRSEPVRAPWRGAGGP